MINIKNITIKEKNDGLHNTEIDQYTPASVNKSSCMVFNRTACRNNSHNLYM